MNAHEGCPAWCTEHHTWTRHQMHETTRRAGPDTLHLSQMLYASSGSPGGVYLTINGCSFGVEQAETIANVLRAVKHDQAAAAIEELAALAAVPVPT